MINPAENQVEVYLRRVERRTRYMEYVKPEDTPKFRSHVRFCYVEAKANEEFIVVIRIHPGFNYFTAAGLQVRLWLDNHDEPDVYFHPKIRSFHPNGNEYVMKDFTAKAGDEWHNGQLAFGEPQFADEQTEPAKGSDFMGSVRVSIQRGFQEQNEDFSIHERVQGEELSSIVPKSAVRVGNVSHVVRPVKAEVVDQPQYAEQFRGLLGQNGAQYIYEFRYRSRQELQQLGLIDMDGARVATPILKKRQTPGLFMTPSPSRQGHSTASPGSLNPPRNTVLILSSRKVKRETSPENTMPVPGSPSAKRTRTFQPPPVITPPPQRTVTSSASKRRSLFGNALLAPSKHSPAPTDTSEDQSSMPPGNTRPRNSMNAASPPTIDVDELDEEGLRLRWRRSEIAMRRVELEQAHLKIEEEQIEVEMRLAQLKKPRRASEL